jgi:hypothetical protein
VKSVQISENTELLEARAGSVRRWSAYGAAFGAAATGAVTLGTLGVVGSLPGAAGLVFGFVLAMGAGGVLGARWKALVARDRGWLSLAGWARRFGLQGFCWGALCAAGGTAVAWSALGLGSRMHLLLWGLMAWAGVAGGLAGALTLGLLGTMLVLDLLRGRTPWRALLLAAVVGPLSFAGAALGMSALLALLGVP